MPNTKGQGGKFKIKATNTFPMASFPRGLGHVTQGYPLLHVHLLQLSYVYLENVFCQVDLCHSNQMKYNLVSRISCR